MKLFPYLAALAALLVLSACATAPDTVPTKNDAPRLAKQDAPEMTGSRIPARRTEKMVSATSGQDYKDTANAQPAPLKVN
jgi:uncharacterized lipoprotein YajG